MPASARPLALPGARDVGQRDALEVDDDLAAGDEVAEARVGVAAHRGRRVQPHEAAHVERLRADRGRGEPELGAGEVADLDVAGEAGGRAHGGDGRLAPQAVDGHVDLAAGGLADALGQVALAVELDHGVGAELAQALQALATAGGGDDAARAEALRRLHGDAADLAGGAEHEHGLPRLEVRAPGEREPAGEAGAAERGGGGVSRPSGTSNSASAGATLRSAMVPWGATESKKTRRPPATPAPSLPTTDGSAWST